jgi:parallel beta-helix repeat protein
MNDQIPPRNRAERRAAMRGKGRRAAGAALTAGSAALAMSAGVLGAGAPSAGAATTITVTNLNDSGAGSLRDALAAAADGDTIDFQSGLTGTLTLTTGELKVQDAVTVAGPGSAAITISGNAGGRVFYLNDPDPSAPITISGLTLTGGVTSNEGGAVFNSGEHLTLANMVITQNSSEGRGGGVASDDAGSSLTMTNTTVTSNDSGDGGGGVFVDNADSLQISGSSVSGNTAGSSGGGLYVETADGPVDISDSHFDGNTTSAGGGGLYFDEVLDTLTISSSSITGNTAENGGGGMYTDYVEGAIDISGTTISNNQAGSSGGGLYLDESHGGVTISNSVISGNTAASDGGGIYVDYFYGGFTIQSTTISNNTAGGAGGGVWHVSGGQGSLVVLDSTISGNTASDGWGGGLYENGSDSPTKIQNSTISGNTATGEGGAMWFGGDQGLELTQSTITGNTATTIGGIALYGPTAITATSGGRHGGVHAAGEKAKAKGHERKAHSNDVQAAALGQVDAAGTILAGNVGEDIGTNDNPGVALTSDHSLLGVIGAGVTVTDAGGTLTGVDPMLGPLQNNGGPTETHALLAGSPAINTGPNPVPSFPTNEFDQRGPGFDRVVAGVVDIGAFEVQPSEGAPEAIVITPKFTG